MIRSRLAQLLLIWLLVLGFNNEMLLTQLNSSMIFVDFNNVQFVFYPILGVVMDVWSARLRVMKLCVLTVIPGLLFGFCSNVLTYLDIRSSTMHWLWIITFTLPFSLYRTNVVPLYVEQMVESPSSEVSAVVYWHFFVMVLPSMIVKLIIPFVAEEKSHLFILQVTVFLSAVYILPCSYCHINPSECDYPHSINPVKLIYRVFQFSCSKKKRTQNARRALLHFEEQCPSCLDQAKQKYGGPFRDNDVEDVKSFLRIIPILICALARTSNSLALPYVNDFFDNQFHFELTDKLLPQFIFHSTILSMILINQFIVSPMFSQYIPTMLRRIGIGLLIAVISTILLIVLQLAMVSDNESITNNICLTQNNTVDASENERIIEPLFAIPVILNGISIYFIVIASLEFTLAQSPACMRGLLIGLWYSTWGLGTIIDYYLYSLLKSCEFHYYIFNGVLELTIFFTFLFFAKKYKMRTRNNNYFVINSDTTNSL